MVKSWILVGMMGAGKSTVGRMLAERAGREFLDTDQLITRRLGRPVNQLFQLYGQDAFREHEAAMIRSLEPGANVIATGGGTVLREDNWEQFRRLGATVYLEIAPELL
jgi:shikimate kinase